MVPAQVTENFLHVHVKNFTKLTWKKGKKKDLNDIISVLTQSISKSLSIKKIYPISINHYTIKYHN